MRTWQDIVLGSGSFIFILTLIPTLLAKDKPPIATSFFTGLVLLVYSYTYFTLSLISGAVSTLALGLVWLLIAVQKYRQLSGEHK